MDTATKVFLVLMGVTVISELTAIYVAGKYHNNMPVYAVFSIVEFALVSLYFGQSIDVFSMKKAGYIIASIGIVAGVLNLLFLQGITKFNSYFLVFEGIGIIGLALFSFFRLLLAKDELKLYRYPHFWFATILAFFWSVTLLNWSLYDYIMTYHKDIIGVVRWSIYAVNMITYSAISCVFILYPKMQKTYER